MDPKLITAALDALESGDAAKALEILKGLIASAAGAPAEAPADAPAEAPVSESTDTPPDDEDETRPPAQATAGAPAGVSALSADEAAELATLRADRIERDLAARRELVAGLVQLGAETPATAWQGDAKKRLPVKRLADEPLAELRARVAALRSAAPRQAVARRPDVAASELTEGEQRQLAAFKTQEQKDRFLALRASRKAVTNG